MSDPEFEVLRRANVARFRSDGTLRKQATEFLVNASVHKYSYNFDWLSLPIIQYPSDIVAIQELICRSASKSGESKWADVMAQAALGPDSR